MKFSLPELTVLIGTCDNYSFLWKNFSILFDRYWNFDTRNVFVGETKHVPQYTSTQFQTIACGKNLNWGEIMLEGINQCNTEKILLLLDDYFLRYSFSKTTILKYLKDFDVHKMDRLQISASGYQTYEYIDEVGYHKIRNSSDYLICTQPSIWRKSFLQKTILPEYSPWDYEIKGSRKIKGSNTKIFSDQSISKTATRMGSEIYYNAINKGKKTPKYYEFLSEHNLK